MRSNQPLPKFYLLRTPAGEPEGPMDLFALRKFVHDPTRTGVELVCAEGAEKWETLKEVVERTWNYVDPATVKPPTRLEKLRARSNYPDTRTGIWVVMAIGVLSVWVAVLSEPSSVAIAAAVASTIAGLFGAQLFSVLLDIADAQIARLPDEKSEKKD